MNLYLISRTTLIEYDTYESAVVCAPSEAEARRMSPCPANAEETWVTPEHVAVRFLGVARAGVGYGDVLCACFRAG